MAYWTSTSMITLQSETYPIANIDSEKKRKIEHEKTHIAITCPLLVTGNDHQLIEVELMQATE